MSGKVLFVDREQLVLQIAAIVLGEFYQVDTAESCEEGLAALRANGPYAAIVSDLSTPGMGGSTFLKLASELAPATPRLGLTRGIDFQAVCDAANDARVFRLLDKRCDVDRMRSALDDAITEYGRIQSEEVRFKRLRGTTVSLLARLLLVVDSVAHKRAMRIAEIAKKVAQILGVMSEDGFDAASILIEVRSLASADKNWLIESAKEVIANMPLSDHCTRRVDPKHEGLTSKEARGLEADGQIAHTAEYILQAVRHLVGVMDQGILPAVALQRMSQQPGVYSRDLIQALRIVIGTPQQAAVEKRSLTDVGPGMLLMQDVVSTDGRILVAKGHKLTETMLTRLILFANNGSIESRILVGEAQASELAI